MTPNETFLVTGALGCVGTWVLHNLAGEGTRTIAVDVASDPARVALVLDADAMRRIAFVQADITDLDALEALISVSR
jgi:UDP-glucuronate 4-epimerase